MTDDTPQPQRPKNYYRFERPVMVAMQLAFDHGHCVFPTHGMVPTRDGGLECNCMSWRRLEAKRLGRAVDQCLAPGKMPAIKAWPTTATADISQIERWFRRNPTFNFGIATGTRSRVWILDVDGDTGMAELAELEKKYGPLPVTWATQSGSGKGCHFWFLLPEGITVRNSQSAIAKCVDVRGEGGQALLPGSTHKSGNRYVWSPGRAPDEVPLVAAPEAWLHLALQACKKTRKGTETVKAKSPARSKESVIKQKVVHDRSIVIGDGEGRGGFHGPINGICVKFFATFGPDAKAEGLRDALKKAVLEAPSHDHDAAAIERYSSDTYLNEAIESARQYIRRSPMKT